MSIFENSPVVQITLFIRLLAFQHEFAVHKAYNGLA